MKYKVVIASFGYYHCWFRKTHLFSSETFPCYPYRPLFNDHKLIKIKNSIFYQIRMNALNFKLLSYIESIYGQKFGRFGPLAGLNIKKYRFCHFLAKTKYIDNDGWIFFHESPLKIVCSMKKFCFHDFFSISKKWSFWN